MTRTAGKRRAKMLGLKKLEKKQARRPIMASSNLEDRILTILNAADGAELSLPDIKERLDQDPDESSVKADTFSVRNAVWRLIRAGRADLTPARLVKSIGTQAIR
jgi:hypothetical protein